MEANKIYQFAAEVVSIFLGSQKQELLLEEKSAIVELGVS
jgi:hypothetical protein